MTAGDVAPWAWVIVGVPVALSLILRWLIRTAGYRCTNCGERMAVFTEVSGREQHKIIRYFREHEHRMPETGMLLVCQRCGLLYDEFSLDRFSREPRPRPICKASGRASVGYMSYAVLRSQLPVFRQKNPELAETCECLRCGRHPMGEGDCALCDTPRRVLGCYACHTLCEWRAVEETEFNVLAPVTARSVIPGPPEDFGG